MRTEADRLLGPGAAEEIALALADESDAEELLLLAAGHGPGGPDLIRARVLQLALRGRIA